MQKETHHHCFNRRTKLWITVYEAPVRIPDTTRKLTCPTLLIIWKNHIICNYMCLCHVIRGVSMLITIAPQNYTLAYLLDTSHEKLLKTKQKLWFELQRITFDAFGTKQMVYTFKDILCKMLINPSKLIKVHQNYLSEMTKTHHIGKSSTQTEEDLTTRLLILWDKKKPYLGYRSLPQTTSGQTKKKKEIDFFYGSLSG